MPALTRNWSALWGGMRTNRRYATIGLACLYACSFLALIAGNCLIASHGARAETDYERIPRERREETQRQERRDDERKRARIEADRKQADRDKERIDAERRAATQRWERQEAECKRVRADAERREAERTKARIDADRRADIARQERIEADKRREKIHLCQRKEAWLKEGGAPLDTDCRQLLGR